MNISRATIRKSGRLSATITLSGAELSWLHCLSAIAVEAGETLGHGYGSDLITAAEIRSLTERIDPHYVEACAACKRDKVNIDAETLLSVVRKVKADQEKQRSEALA